MATYRDRSRTPWAVLAALASASLAVTVLSSCKEVEEVTHSSGYRPATVETIPGSEVKRVSIDRRGAERIGLQTATAGGHGQDAVVPYAALIYDGQGRPWVYVNTRPSSYVRVPVVVEHISGDRVTISRGPRPGAHVVTIGATEVYGAELEIAGGH